MKTIRALTTACAVLTILAAGAQTPPAATPPGSAADRMTMMEKHMVSMREMHERMVRARTPEERQALMADHAKLMQEGMAMMGGMGPGAMGMGPGGMGGMGGMGAMGRSDPKGPAASPTDMAARQQMMEKRMDMMQSMMQMMMDRMHAPPPAPK